MARDVRSINPLSILAAAITILATASFAVPRLAAAAAVGITPEILAAAKKEGNLTYYTAVELPIAQQFKAAFEKTYGITVNILRMSSSTLFNRAVPEFDTGVNAADVICHREQQPG